jgi:hypothetical protein
MTHKFGACRTINCSVLMAVREPRCLLGSFAFHGSLNTLICHSSNKKDVKEPFQNLLGVNCVAGKFLEGDVKQTTRWGRRILTRGLSMARTMSALHHLMGGGSGGLRH